VLAGRTAAVALLLVAVGAATALVAVPFAQAYRDYDASIAQLQGQLARYTAMEAMRQPLEARLAQLNAQRPDAEDLLGGGSPAVSGARLQELVKRTVAEGRGNFVSAQDLAPESEGTFERIGLRVQFITTVEGLLRSLHAIESSRPLLFVETLDIRGRAVRKGNEFDRTTAVPLTVTIDVSGFRRKEKS
jgi:general secretion pathway protein M